MNVLGVFTLTGRVRTLEEAASVGQTPAARAAALARAIVARAEEVARAGGCIGGGELAARLGGEVPAEEHWLRPARELAPVCLFGDDWGRLDGAPVYEVWRGVSWEPPPAADTPATPTLATQAPLPGGARSAGEGRPRLDFTLMYPGHVRGEPYRTAGHVHRLGRGRHFGEIYQVLAGKALFVLVRPLRERWAVLAVEAEPGDAVVIPPPYGHFTVNAGETPLLCANLVDRRCQGDYDAFRRWGVRCWVLRRGGGDGFAAARLVVEPAAGQSVSVARLARGQRGPWVARGLAPLWLLPPWVAASAGRYLVGGEPGLAPGEAPVEPRTVSA